MSSQTTRRLNLRQASVLAVDDNPMSMDLLKQILNGFRIKHLRECSSAEEARKAIDEEPFDLLLIDGEMPAQSGIDLSRYVRSRVDQTNFTTPIMIVTAFTPPTTVREARDNGVNMVVSKPVSPAALLSRIEWIARNDRAFVVADNYSGPDRRFRKAGPPQGTDERRAEALALTADATREMSQADLDSLFG